MRFIKKAIATLLIPTSIFAYSQVMVSKTIEKFEGREGNKFVRDNFPYVAALVSETYPNWWVLGRHELLSSFWGDRKLHCAAVYKTYRMTFTPWGVKNNLDPYQEKELTRTLLYSLENNNKTAQRCRDFMMETIGQIGDKEASDFLLEDLKSGKPHKGTVRAMIELKDKRVVPYLIRIINDENTPSDMFQNAYYALGEIGDQRAIPYMFKILSSYRFYTFRFGGEERAVEAFVKMKNIDFALNYAMKKIRKEGPYDDNRPLTLLIIKGGKRRQKEELKDMLYDRARTYSRLRHIDPYERLFGQTREFLYLLGETSK